MTNLKINFFCEKQQSVQYKAVLARRTNNSLTVH